jgi:hypothetical protein
MLQFGQVELAQAAPKHQKMGPLYMADRVELDAAKLAEEVEDGGAVNGKRPLPIIQSLPGNRQLASFLSG